MHQAPSNPVNQRVTLLKDVLGELQHAKTHQVRRLQSAAMALATNALHRLSTSQMMLVQRFHSVQVVGDMLILR